MKVMIRMIIMIVMTDSNKVMIESNDGNYNNDINKNNKNNEINDIR